MNYEQFIALYLNLEWNTATSVLDGADSVRLGHDNATVPNEWIDLVTDDPIERAKWRQRELRKEQ